MCLTVLLHRFRSRIGMGFSMVSSVRSVKLTAGEDGHQLGLSHGGQSKPDFRDSSCKVDATSTFHAKASSSLGRG